MPEFVVRVDKPAHGGSCVGRANGRVVFCTYCLPGETVRAALVDGDDDSRFWRAETVAVIEGSGPSRVTSPCPWFGPGLCGGCAWLHTDPQTQVELKAQVLAESLERIGGIGWPDVSVRSLGVERGWRTRIALHVDPHGHAGFHAVRSNDFVPVADCLQADPRMGLAELLERRWPAESTVHISVSDAGRAIVVIGAHGREVSGPAEHVHAVLGREFRCAPDGFWQPHRDAATLLATVVRELARPAPDCRVLDLYAGVGLFGLTLIDAMAAGAVRLVEGDRVAAEFARVNAAGDPRVEVERRDIRRWARRPAQPFDLVVLDPPRAGAGREVVAAVAAAAPAVVVYVSCEPTTLARDLKYFAAAGYRPDHVEGLDLFPGTAHVETVVRLRPASLAETCVAHPD